MTKLDGPGPNKTNYRWVICTLLFFATMINYIDRQAIGLLKPFLEKEFSWSEQDYAYIVVAFSAMYAFGYIIFGRFIDKVGVKIGYAVSVAVWSIAAILHGFARGATSFAVYRSMLGLAEPGSFPASVKAVTEWFPKKERAMAVGFFNSGTSIGPVVAPLLIPLLLSWWGWRSAFIITGALGFIWLIFWKIYYTAPNEQSRVNKEELAYINQDKEEEEDENSNAKPSWRTLISLRQTWVFISGKVLTDPIWWFFLFWLPSYFTDTFNLDLSKPSLHLAVVYGATTLGGLGGGYFSSWLVKKGGYKLPTYNWSYLALARLVLSYILECLPR